LPTPVLPTSTIFSLYGQNSTARKSINPAHSGDLRFFSRNVRDGRYFLRFFFTGWAESHTKSNAIGGTFAFFASRRIAS